MRNKDIMLTIKAMQGSLDEGLPLLACQRIKGTTLMNCLREIIINMQRVPLSEMHVEMYRRRANRDLRPDPEMTVGTILFQWVAGAEAPLERTMRVHIRSLETRDIIRYQGA